MGLHFDIGDVGLIHLGVARIILHYTQDLFQRGARNKDRSDPILNEAARERDNAVALDGLRRHRARQQPRANIGRLFKPEEMLAAPAWLHS